MSEQVTTDDSSIDSAASALSAGLGGGCARVALVVAIHDLASHFENALYAFRDDAEGLLKAKRDIAWARKTAAQHNYNGTGCKEPPNDLGEGRERGILREASSAEVATSTDGLEGGTKGLK